MIMEDTIRENLISAYQNTLVNMETNDIKALEYGFMNDSCDSTLLSILIHCMNNIDIFSASQLNNISHFINKFN